MSSIEELINHGNEDTNLDFKQAQYRKENHQALIKDVIAMANAHIKHDRYIILGVEHNTTGSNIIHGIKEDEFIDEATYQQVIHENIEPHIHIRYYSHSIDSKIVGILRISDCINPPYIMKKDFGSRNGSNSILKKGEAWIRRGSTQLPMERDDYDIIYAERYKTVSPQDIILRSDPKKDWTYTPSKDNKVTILYKHDTDLRFEVNYPEDVHREDFRAEWLQHFAVRSANSFYYSLYKNASPVGRFILVNVDGGRALLPIPEDEKNVLALNYKVAQIFDRTGKLDLYMKIAGFVVE